MPSIDTAPAFSYDAPLQRIVCEDGAVDRLGPELDGFGLKRALVICGQNTRRTRLYARAMESLGERRAATFEGVRPHSGIDICDEAAALARAHDIDCLVAVGGGSSSDTAKAVAILLAEGGQLEDHTSVFVPPDHFVPRILHRPKLPVIALPTTASAAEVTPGLGIRAPDGRKLLFWDHKLASRLILLDPVANLEVPVELMAASSMNGLAHCVEALYSRLRNPMSEALALQSARLFGRHLPAMVARPDDVRERRGIQVAATISGMALSNTRTCIHHVICHCLGALGGLSHGVANSVMLPYAMAYNADAAASHLRDLADAMDIPVAGRPDAWAAQAAVERVRRLQEEARVPARLRETGIDRSLFPAIAEHAFLERGILFNPRPIRSAEQILELVESAW